MEEKELELRSTPLNPLMNVVVHSDQDETNIELEEEEK
ncbi:hypothetical protein J2S02_000551 [Metabacillus niabensis]|uniref:Uncharacterized protein n=1 Tax=Metabacillus niabensis TaxID=324854 RepID=A0ABT9YW53_9BACI|nr:hypothetical protein [Metabacillus niabensis]